MPFENASIYYWNGIIDTFSLIGMLFGWMMIEKSFRGVMLGFIIVKSVQIVLTPFLISQFL